MDAKTEAVETTKRRYWYFITIDECPVCGRDREYRQRRYTPRPEDPNERHVFNPLAYDDCMEF